LRYLNLFIGNRLKITHIGWQRPAPFCDHDFGLLVQKAGVIEFTASAIVTKGNAFVRGLAVCIRIDLGPFLACGLWLIQMINCHN